MCVIKAFLIFLVFGCILVFLLFWAGREKINAENLPREVFGVKLGFSVEEIKNTSPRIMQDDKRYLVYPHPSPEIKGIYFNLSKGETAVLISFNFQYEKDYSAKTPFRQFRSELEKKFGPSSQYWNDREWVKEQIYWKDEKTRIIAGQDFGGEFFLTYEDLTH